ncbi:MAG: hypothetical protein ABI700_24210 [Chloroflexota bacterium]
MATGQSDDELMRILKFDADDLKQNQSGQASLQQRVNLLLKANHFLLIMLVLTPVGVVWWIGDHQPVLQIVGLVALTAVVAAFNRPSLKILRAFSSSPTAVVQSTRSSRAVERAE